MFAQAVTQTDRGSRVGARPRRRTAPAGRLAQPVRGRRPEGVRGPELETPVSSLLRAPELGATCEGRPARPVAGSGPIAVPPPALESGVRLTDRGLALVMTVAVALVVASLVCIVGTAVRVTSEPAGADVVATAAR